ELLLAFASLLRNRVSSEEDFLGHIGGDDFIAVFRDENWDQTVREILREFQVLVPGFYNAGHLAQGGLPGRDREGRERVYPVISVSASALYVAPGDCHDVADISARLSAVKQRSK